MSKKSIRSYFLGTITTVLLASFLVMGLVQTLLAVEYFSEEKEQLLSRVVETVCRGFSCGQVTIDEDSVYTVSYIAEAADAVIILATKSGEIWFSTGPAAPEVGQVVSEDVLGQISYSNTSHQRNTLGKLFDNTHYISARVLRDSDNVLVGYVFAASAAATLQVFMLEMMSAFSLSVVVVLIAAGLLSLALTGRTLTPIKHISDGATRFAEGDFSYRIPVEGDDELSRLAVTFNEMASHFEATDTSRRNFMGNIAHELRTPMTTIKGFIDGMLDGTIPTDQREHYLTVVSDEVGRLARLTKNMLDVSRLESGEYVPNTSVFNIWEPTAAIIMGAQRRLVEKELQVKGINNDIAAMVSADEDFVHQILFNLIDNAVKFATEGSTIVVQAKTVKGQVVVSVQNEGPSIPEESLPYVFDRFFKVDKSRGEDARGAGLGLHISKVLTNLMNGRIWAESGDGYTRFLLSLPAAPKKRTSRTKA